MNPVPDGHGHVEGGECGILFGHVDGVDIGAQLGDAVGEGGKHAALVDQLDAQGGGEFLLHLFVPAQRDAFFRGVSHFCKQVLAGVPMHHDAATGTQMADDGIAGQGQAALGVADHQAFTAADGQRATVVLMLTFIVIAGAGQLAGHQRRQAIAHADVFQQVVQLHIAVSGQLAHHPFDGQLVHADVIRVQGFLQ